MRKSEKGFGLAGVLLVLLVIGAAGFAGYRIIGSKNAATITQPSTKQETATPKAPETAGQSETYCDSIEKSCITFDSSWKKNIATFDDQDNNKQRQNLDLTSEKYPFVKITFSPYVYGVGGGCQSGDIIKSDDVKLAPSQKLIESSGTFQEFSNSKPFGPPKYFARLAVEDASVPSSVTVGKKDCLSLGLYANQNYKDGRYGALVARSTSDYFATEKELTDWRNSDGVVAARKILASLNLKQ